MAQQNITAIIFDKRGRPLSIGYNSYTKTHPLQAKIAAKVGEPHKVYLHAEIDALIKLPYEHRNRAHKIVVMRYNKKGEPMNAKPCAVCQEMLSRTKMRVEHT
jgi:deoxycytidylate deaminase